ncbi:methyltransferase domain-containing protein [Tepidiphilus olei]|uniref:methyltransferase domain-containing protein n=1 Tax=Tepidiphilus olei TaxID=2502184 RepID=UPI00115C5605|nr:methyltransferase domain-containing protein [Tepidiphilus olei]
MTAPLDLDALLERLRREAAALPADDLPDPLPLDTTPPEPVPALPLSPVALLALPPADFLPAAYRQLLGRDPDSSGQATYQNLLAQGHARSEILYALAHSPEGRARGARLPGLSWRALLCRWSLATRRYRPSRLRAALLAGRGGAIGAIYRRLPSSLQHAALAPFYLAALPSRWLRRWETRCSEPLASLLSLLEAQKHRTDGLEALLHGHLDRTRARLDHLEAQSIRHTEQLQHLDAQSIRHTEQLQHLEAQSIHHTEQLERHTAALRHRLARLEHAPLLERPTAPPPPEPGQDQLNAFYLAFEDACRGSEAEIRATQRLYLEHLAHSPAAQGLPVLDLGCGRGEWLALLTEAGYAARGIDLNPLMLERARAQGLDVACQDALAALAAQPDASLGAVTAFHLVEHLPFPTLYRLFAEIARTLAPGGLLIAETPNPENLLVGSHTFYHDPTHRNPVTPTFLRFLAHYHGFTRIDILRLHPYPESAKVPGNDPLTERVNGHLCGPQDYALIAQRPLDA